MKIISAVGARLRMVAPQQSGMGLPAGKTTHPHQTANSFSEVFRVVAAKQDLKGRAVLNRAFKHL
jgi:hypothetical protein